MKMTYKDYEVFHEWLRGVLKNFSIPFLVNPEEGGTVEGLPKLHQAVVSFTRLIREPLNEMELEILSKI
jgi:hypothetical protein